MASIIEIKLFLENIPNDKSSNILTLATLMRDCPEIKLCDGINVLRLIVFMLQISSGYSEDIKTNFFTVNGKEPQAIKTLLSECFSLTELVQKLESL